MTTHGIDVDRVRAACEGQAARPVAGIDDIAAYLARQVGDESHREVLGPLLAGSGASGVVVHCGQEVGSWGDPAVPEMLFSATKSGWSYNDVRVNLLCLALTALFRRSLPDVLRDAVMTPLGASTSWSWHGYRNAHLEIDGARVPS